MKSYPEESNMLGDKIKQIVKDIYFYEFFKREGFEFLK